MLSIVIPAHNEEAGVSKTLDCFLRDNALTNADVFVVCNGCTDNTALYANEFIRLHRDKLATRSVSLNVIEIEKASKIAALNEGLSLVEKYPVILLDADILITGHDLIALSSSLVEKELLAAAPKVMFDWQKSSFLAQCYYRISSSSDYNKAHRLSNVIALSENGVKRLCQLPEVIADDEYIRRQFNYKEYQICQDISFVFTCPRNIINVINVLTRVERGNMQLSDLGHVDGTGATLAGPKKRPFHAFVVFAVCKIIAKLRAKRQLRSGQVIQWERDESNR
ncbi:glycosyltransferase [Thalassotalea fusca]